jgi:hypothetical protein
LSTTKEKAPVIPRVPTRDEAFASVRQRIVELTPQVRSANLEHERLKEETKAAKAIWEGHSHALTSLCEELVEIEAGTWQPRLPFPVEETAKPKKSRKKKPADPGATDEISVLTGYGMTEKQIATLLQSQLAAEGPFKTIADLEAAIRKDEWWHKKIKGFGESKRDALLDAIVAYRAKFPVPSEEDDEPEPTEEQPAADAVSADGEQTAPADPVAEDQPSAEGTEAEPPEPAAEAEPDPQAQEEPAPEQAEEPSEDQPEE